MRRGARDVIIFYHSTLHSMLNFDLQIFGFRKEKRKKGESPVFQSTYRLKDGHTSWLRRQIAALAPPMLGLWAQRPPGTARSSRVSPALAPPPAAASTYPRSPGREWECRLHARGGGAGSTMVPGAAAAAPWPACSPRAILFLQTFGFCGRQETGATLSKSSRCRLGGTEWGGINE